jgi:hypothetical protein
LRGFAALILCTAWDAALAHITIVYPQFTGAASSYSRAPVEHPLRLIGQFAGEIYEHSHYLKALLVVDR